MKTTCNVIQDLLPLYCDDACSAESRRLVEEHLKECDDCRETYQLMQAALPASAAHTQQQATAQAAQAWTASIRKNVRRAYLILLAIVVALIAAVCLYHGLNSTAEGSILGMTAQAEKLLSAENSELVLARKRGDYLAVLLRMDSGGCGVDILERDSLFHGRWRGGPGSAGQPAGYLQVSDLGSSDEPLLVAYGLDLPESACWYTFEYANTTYTRPIVSRRVLDMFLPMDSVQPHYTITVTLLDENMQPIA